jgi:hypothetical protein
MFFFLVSRIKINLSLYWNGRPDRSPLRLHTTWCSFPVFYFFIGLLILAAHAPSLAGYGDVSGGLPSWKERQILVLTNACRMAPIQYRDTYVGSFAILDSSKYPAVPPLYLNPQLNASARAHSLDMGDTCGIMQHNSCNGTAWNTRIKAYYTASSSIGENIAVGNADPFTTMNQWIMDTPQGSDQPAPDFSWCKTSTGDSSRCDGHRSNIMSKQYKEMGAGYAYGTNSAARFHPFWVQDFGGGKPAYSNPIVGGSHFLKETGKTTFLANYYDPALKAPAEASVTIAGQKFTMTLKMGKPFQGTYELAASRGSACRDYFFSFTDAAGKTWRYPEQGTLVTSGEGGCTGEYKNLTDRIDLPAPCDGSGIALAMKSSSRGNVMTLAFPRSTPLPQSASLVDGSGKALFNSPWPKGGEMRVTLDPGIPRGIYFLVVRASGGGYIKEKIVLGR